MGHPLHVCGNSERILKSCALGFFGPGFGAYSTQKELKHGVAVKKNRDSVENSTKFDNVCPIIRQVVVLAIVAAVAEGAPQVRN